MIENNDWNLTTKQNLTVPNQLQNIFGDKKTSRQENLMFYCAKNRDSKIKKNTKNKQPTESD